jgi:hypothetical protein
LDLKRTVAIGRAEKRNMSLKANDSHRMSEKTLFMKAEARTAESTKDDSSERLPIDAITSPHLHFHPCISSISLKSPSSHHSLLLPRPRSVNSDRHLATAAW